MSLIRTLSAMLKDKKLCPEPVECLYVGCSGRIKFTREGDKVIARCAGTPDRRCGFEISMDSSVDLLMRDNLDGKNKYVLRFMESERCPRCGNILCLLEGAPGVPAFHICYWPRCGYIVEIGVGTVYAMPDTTNRAPIYFTEEG